MTTPNHEGGDEHDTEPGDRVVALGPDTAQRGVDGPLTDRERRDEEAGDTHHREGELVELEPSSLGETGDEPERDPPDDVVGHAGGQRELTEVAPHETHLREDLGDHRQRRDGQGGGDEQGEDVALGPLPPRTPTG